MCTIHVAEVEPSRLVDVTCRLCMALLENLSFLSGETLPRGHLPPAKSEYNTYYLYREGEGPYAAPTRDDGSSSRRRRRSSRKTRKVIAEVLTKLLLESCSPSESDEDNEAIALR